DTFPEWLKAHAGFDGSQQADRYLDITAFPEELLRDRYIDLQRLHVVVRGDRRLWPVLLGAADGTAERAALVAARTHAAGRLAQGAPLETVCDEAREVALGLRQPARRAQRPPKPSRLGRILVRTLHGGCELLGRLRRARGPETKLRGKWV